SPKRLLMARASRTRARSVAIASTDSGIGPTVVGLRESRAMRLVFIGDVVGGTGRRALEAVLPELRSRYEPDFLVVNGENAAGGLGITEKIARDWLAGGIDAITLGNHAYKQRDVYEFLDREERIVRPANYPRGNPGRDTTGISGDAGKLAVVNLSGTVFLDAARSPFSEA